MAGHSNNSIWDSWFIGAILVILGLLNLGLQIARIDRGKSRETFNFPKKGKGKNSTNGKQTRKGADTVEMPKCNLCRRPYRYLISCPKLTQYIRLTLDIGCIITLGVICVFLTGFMWYHVEFKDYQFPSWLTDKN